LQPGDVPETFSNVDLLERLTGFKPNTDINFGVRKFIEWYKSYYG
jgi:UDP-glucuronate 4-epimerase